MSADGERAQVREAVERVRQRAVQELDAAPGAGQAVRFVEVLHHNLDQLFDRSRASDLAPACEAGCAHCCSARVEVCEPEALRIAEHLRRLPLAEQAQWSARLGRRVAADRAQEHSGRTPCEFLQAQRCSIYAVRSAVCPKAHSLSVGACAQQSTTIPQNLDLLLQDEILMAGTFEAYRSVGLAASPRELSEAVLDALQDRDAAENWFSSGTRR